MHNGSDDLARLSKAARQAVQGKDWATVATLARKIQKHYKKNPEGYFLHGLADKAAQRTQAAATAFLKALKLDARRYDAAVELANQYLLLLRHGEAFELLRRYESRLDNSPLYLYMAASTYSRLGLHARAWPLYQKANRLQPDVDDLRANLAACAVLVGRIEEATSAYQNLLEKHPQHQRNHYALSRLKRAKDAVHVEQMQRVLEVNRLPAEKNIFLYYAIAKELEDLERWQEAFHYYKLAGEAVSRVATYDVATDTRIMNRIIEVCDADWLADSHAQRGTGQWEKTPIFIVGLPRTGTTLMERIVASHSQVDSADETYFLQMSIRHAAVGGGIGDLDPVIIEKAAHRNIRSIAEKYMSSVDYRLGDRPLFIEKFPFNFLYLGFIAKAFPGAHLIHLRRNPMDACFAMYKQSFFKFAYTLENVGKYYLAFERLYNHWKDVLSDRLIEVNYEALVTDQETQTRAVLKRLGLDFEQACLDFEQNTAPSATASTVQIREKVHTRSVNKWKHFREQLQPLKDYLDQAGIHTD